MTSARTTSTPAGKPAAERTTAVSDRTILAAHTDGLRKHGLGPHKVNEAVAGYLRAEAQAGRIRADADLYAAAGLLAGACMQHAFLGHMGWVDRRDDEAAARSFARTVIAGLRGE